MSALVDGGGRSVFLGTQIGKGGEATISAVAGRPELVAKIWHEPASAERAGKLRWMLAHPPADPAAARGHVSIPWPCSPISDETGALRGFLMPRLAEARPLFEVFNPARRRVTAPGWDGRYLFRAARNLASVVAAIHEKGYVVGDLNESNVLVAPTALVSVVDTDSFQVRAVEGGREVVYPCRVGKPEYLAPELQGVPLASVVRAPAQDAWALAVLLFQLLMEGSHPFRGRWEGAGEPPSLELSIGRGLYPHSVSGTAAAPVAPPPGSPPVGSLDPRLAALFERCFVAGHADPAARPTAAEWERALAAVEAELVACPRGHWHDRDLAACPLCAIEDAKAAARARAAQRPRPAALIPAATPTPRPAASPPRRRRRQSSPAPAPLQPTARPTPSGPPPSVGSGASNPIERWFVRLGYRLAASLATGRPNPFSWAFHRLNPVALLMFVVFGLLVVIAAADWIVNPRPGAPLRARSGAVATSRPVGIQTAQAAWTATANRTATARVALPTPTSAPAVAPTAPVPDDLGSGVVLFEDGFDRGRGRLGGSPAGGFASEGRGYLHLATDFQATEGAEPAFFWRVASRLDAAAGVALSARVDQVSGTAQALLTLKDGTGKRAVLAVDPGQRLWRFGVSAAGNPIAWDGPARRFGDDSAEPAMEEAELRVVGGEVAVVVADEVLPLDDPPALSPPFEAELGVAVEDGAQGSGWVRFDSVRAHAVAVAAPVSGPVPGAELLAAEAFDGEPRTVPYDNPALSGWVNDGALVLRSTTNRTWPTYPTGIEVGPVAAASVVVALGEASGEGIPVLLLRGGEGQQARFDLDLDELRLRYGHSAGAGKRVTFGNWRAFPADAGSVETAEIRIVGGEAALLLDGATAVSGLPLSPGFTDGPFSVVLGAYHHQTSRPVDFAVAFGDVAVYRLPPGSPLPSPAASPGAAPTVPPVPTPIPTPVPTPAPTPAMPDGDLVDENAFGGPRRSLTWADDPAFAGSEGDGALRLATEAADRGPVTPVLEGVRAEGGIAVVAGVTETAGSGAAVLQIDAADGGQFRLLVDARQGRWRYEAARGNGEVVADAPWRTLSNQSRPPRSIELRIRGDRLDLRVNGQPAKAAMGGPEGLSAGPLTVSLGVEPDPRNQGTTFAAVFDRVAVFRLPEA